MNIIGGRSSILRGFPNMTPLPISSKTLHLLPVSRDLNETCRFALFQRPHPHVWMF